MRCIRCGSKLKDDENFCDKCKITITDAEHNDIDTDGDLTRWRGVRKVKIEKALENLNNMHCPDCGGFMNKSYGNHGELFRFYCSKCQLGVPVPKR